MIKNLPWFKNLARWILQEDLDTINTALKNTVKNEERLSDLVNMMKDERPLRKYAFAPESLTAEEQKIIGEFGDSEIFGLYNKWFKYQADKNNDLLVHAHKSTEDQRSLWRLAVLMFDDWAAFTRNCKKLSEK